jgi:hypothetical protein
VLQQNLALGALLGNMNRKNEVVAYLEKAEGMFKEMGMDS